jgi:dolichol-phosphate mannosyltransferase
MRVVEVPITFVERVEGTSKMSGAIVREALWQVTRWGVERRVLQLRQAALRR